MSNKNLEANPINILYLTTKCNFKCTYCYENQKDISDYTFATNEEIQNFVDHIVETSDKTINNYTVCLMGGEPFCAIEQMRFFMNYIKKYTSIGKQFSINVITNGSLIHNYIDDIRAWMKQDKVFYSLDISYDGSWQYRRTDSDIVERNMDLFTKECIPFGLSYTITKDNMLSSQYLPDLIKMIYRWLNPIYNRSRQRIRVNTSWNDIKNIEEYRNKLVEQSLYIFIKYKVSICQYSCEYCKSCNFTNTGKQYMIPNKGIEIETMYSEKKYQHFKWYGRGFRS